MEYCGGRVLSIDTKANNGLATPRGIAVGSTLDELLNAYGNPGRIDKRGNQECYCYGAYRGGGLGLWFYVVNGKVVKITGADVE